MTLFTQAGDAFIPTVGRHSMLETLPTGNFIVVRPPMGPMFFQQVDRFPESGRMYGDVRSNADRIMKTFLDRPRATGVLLDGEKGSGKSQLARVVSEIGYDAGIPTILINDPFFGDDFNKLLGALEQPAIVIFDEFEKVYREQPHQEAILTLLDGVMTTQKLFIFTTNSTYRINEHMKNRPGRMFYWFDFGGLAPEFIREYCIDNLNDQSEIEGIVTVSAMFRAFNFDMLKAMVEEMNRYREPALEVIKILNTKPYVLSSQDVYEVVVTTDTGVKSEVLETSEIPLAGSSRGEETGFYAKFTGHPEYDGDDDQYTEKLASWEKELLGSGSPKNSGTGEDGSMYITVQISGLQKLDVATGRYQFIAMNGMTVDFKRKDKTGPSLYPKGSY